MITKQSKTKLNTIYIYQTAKSPALWSGNVDKFEFLTDGDFLLEKDLLETAATTKDLNIHLSVVSWKSKFSMQKSNIKD